jgi:predicted dehydrogenase
VEIVQKDPLEEEIRAFIEAVTNKTDPPVSGREGRDVLAVALRILEEIRKAQERIL